MKNSEALNRSEVVTVLPRTDGRIFGLEMDKIGVPHGLSLQDAASQSFAIAPEARTSKNVEQKSVTRLSHFEVL